MTERRQQLGHSSPPSSLCYAAYGLNLRSPIQLPGLMACELAETSNVTIRFCTVPERLQNPLADWGWLQHDDQACLIHVEGMARFLVVGGRQIHIDRRVIRDPQHGGTRHQDLCVYLLGFVMSVLLYQRRQAPLHLLALETPGGNLGLVGESGAGKSTLGAYLQRRHGWRVLCDDLAALEVRGEALHCQPGPAGIKLHDDAVEQLGISHDSLEQELTSATRYRLPAVSSASAPESAALDALVLLAWAREDEPVTLERLSGIEAFHAARECLYWPELGTLLDSSAAMLEHISHIASRARLYRLRRPRSFIHLEAGADLLHDLMMAEAIA